MLVDLSGRALLPVLGLASRSTSQICPGSGTLLYPASQDPAFLAATGAGLAVISVGLHNTYGHPAAVTLAALAADGMAVRRTDLDGDVAIVAGSGGLRVITRLP